MKIRIEEILDNISTSSLGQLITQIESAQVLPGNSRLQERLEQVKCDYELMRTFMISGGKDPQREFLYESLRRKVYCILADARMSLIIKDVASYRQAAVNTPDFSVIAGSMKDALESFESDIAMGGLYGENAESKQMEVRKRQHDYRQTYFKSILVSSQIGKNEQTALISILLSDTIDQTDKVLIISALLLSLQTQYDDRKFSALLSAFNETDDKYVHSHLLVAIALSMHNDRLDIFKDTDNELLLAFSDESVKKDLYQLQIQLLLCNNVDEVDRTLKDDIIPTIMKHQNPEDILKNDTIEGSSINEILKPNTSDESIDELEQTIGKMDNMQKNGLDIYFGGFSKMKRSAFFYTLVNWFYPFSVDHPQLSHINSKLLHSNLVKLLVVGSPLCDSDMYSMVIGMQQVFDMLPQQFKDLFDREEVKVRESIDRNTPAYYRRMYLQNLLRFYRLYPSKQDFTSPFALNGTEEEEEVATRGWLFMKHPLICDSGLFVEEEISLLKYLFKKGKYETCTQLAFRMYGNNTTSKQDTFISLIYGLSDYERGYYADACQELREVLTREPNNMVALRYLVIGLLAQTNYAEAVEYAKRLADANHEDLKDRMYYLISLVGSGRVEEASPELFRLYYEYPDSQDLQETVAWAYLYMKKVDKAEELFSRLLDLEDISLTVIINAFYAYLFTGKISKAVEVLRRMQSKMIAENVGNTVADMKEIIMEEASLLQTYGFSKTDIEVLIDCI